MCARINTFKNVSSSLQQYCDAVTHELFVLIDTNLCERKLLQKIGLRNGKQYLPNTLIIQTY